MRYKILPTRTGYTIQCQMSINKQMHTLCTEHVVAPKGKDGYGLLRLAVEDLATRRPHLKLEFADKS